MQGQEVIIADKKGELVVGVVKRVRLEVELANGKKTLISENSVLLK